MKKLPALLVALATISSASFALACDKKSCAMHHDAPALSKELRKNHAVLEYTNAVGAMHDGMRATYTGNADVDFVTGMIPHHQGAVDMAQVQLRYGKCEKLKKLARWIIASQQQELGYMKTWLAGRSSTWRAENVNALPSVQEYEKAAHAMHTSMNIAYSGNPDVDFARGMIPHHQGAVDMAWVVKRHGIDPSLNKFAGDIIVAQESEIAFMKEWLAEHDVPAAPERKKNKMKKKKKHHDHASH